MRTHMMEEEKRLFQAAFWPPHVWWKMHTTHKQHTLSKWGVTHEIVLWLPRMRTHVHLHTYIYKAETEKTGSNWEARLGVLLPT